VRDILPVLSLLFLLLAVPTDCVFFSPLYSGSADG
jgi:hypothetical protein